MYVVLDTETNDLPKNWKLPPTALDNWPRIVQIAWMTFDEAGTETSRFQSLVKPEGFTIAPGAQRTHGITMEKAEAEGRPLAEVLDACEAVLGASTMLIAHNLNFDASVMTAEFLRSGRADALQPLRRYCTMLAGTSLCRLPGRFGFKWPTLAELHTHLFGEAFAGAHDALVDVEACARCFLEMRKRDAERLVNPLADRPSAPTPTAPEAQE